MPQSGYHMGLSWRLQRGAVRFQHEAQRFQKATRKDIPKSARRGDGLTLGCGSEILGGGTDVTASPLKQGFAYELGH